MKLKKIQKQIKNELYSFNSFRLQLSEILVKDRPELEMKETLMGRLVYIMKLIQELVDTMESVDNGDMIKGLNMPIPFNEPFEDLGFPKGK